MGDKAYTRTERAIQEFLGKYDTDTLISVLDGYSKSISPADYKKFHKIKKVTCDEFKIPIADLGVKTITSTQATLARKIISYLAYRHTNLSAKHIALMQNSVARTAYNHIEEITFFLENPASSYGGFVEKYANIIKELNYEDGIGHS
jgi:chromosomal replication initiation ATPase DnaA